jgi:hypothetical protein
MDENSLLMARECMELIDEELFRTIVRALRKRTWQFGSLQNPSFDVEKYSKKSPVDRKRTQKFIVPSLRLSFSARSWFPINFIFRPNSTSLFRIILRRVNFPVSSPSQKIRPIWHEKTGLLYWNQKVDTTLIRFYGQTKCRLSGSHPICPESFQGPSGTSGWNHHRCMSGGWAADGLRSRIQRISSNSPNASSKTSFRWRRTPYQRFVMISGFRPSRTRDIFSHFLPI